jgi:hypothetical protein
VPLEMTEGNYSNVGHRGPVYKGLGAMNPCDNLHHGPVAGSCTDSSPNIILVIKSRRIGCVGNVARVGDTRGAYRVLIGRHEGKRPLGRP